MNQFNHHPDRSEFSSAASESSQDGEEFFEDEEEDGDEIGAFDPVETEYCPHCHSSSFDLYTTKGGYTVMKCEQCNRLFCPNSSCKSQIEDSSLPPVYRGIVHCQKCGAVLG
jgi:hypothetical protein